MPSVLYPIASVLIMLNIGIFAALYSRRTSFYKRPLWAFLSTIWILGFIGSLVGLVIFFDRNSGLMLTGIFFLGLWLMLRIRRSSHRKGGDKKQFSMAYMPRASGEIIPVLESLGIDGDEIIVTFASDISLDGRYDTEYVAATENTLHFIGRSEDELKQSREIPLGEIEEIASEKIIGGGRLAIRLKGEVGPPKIYARYSNSCREAFSRLARTLSGRINPEEELTDTLSFEEKDETGTNNKSCPKCGRPYRHGTTVCPVCIKKGRTLARLAKMSAKYWRRILAVIILMTLGTLGTLVAPMLEMEMVDNIFRPVESAHADNQAISQVPEGYFTGMSTMSALGVLVGLELGLLIFSTVLGIFRGRMSTILGATVGTELRAMMFHHIQKLSLSYFDKQETGALMSRTDHDTRRLQDFLIEGLPFFFLAVLNLVGIIGVLFWINWRLACWALLPAPVLFVISGMVFRLTRGIFRKLWGRVARLSAFLNDSISGIRVVKAFGQEEREKDGFNERNMDVYRDTVRAETIFATIMPLMGMFMALGAILVRYVGGRGVIEGAFKYGLLVAYGRYLIMFYRPLRMVLQFNSVLTRSMTAAERVFDVLDTEPEIIDNDSSKALDEVKGHIEVQNISFGYEKYNPVIENISFDVKPGEMIGFVGHSGAGKTTTINLLCRLYDVDEGAIKLDGVDLRDIKLQDLRSKVGVVLQETYLFTGTVGENIAYARPDASRDDIIRAAITANAHEFIMEMPDAYDSDIEEQGKNLSVGQKQRIGIARAILHNPQILILDEATSSIDTETEQQIQTALNRLIENRTTFAIAHRLSTLANADRLIVLEKGEIAEMGTHKELLDSKGVYFNLVEAQSNMTKSIVVGG